MERGIENIVGKGENAEYQHFLLFPQFSAIERKISQFEQSLQMLSSGKELLYKLYC